MSPKFAFFDTNTWIYLANGFDAFAKQYGDLHFKVFDILEKRVNDGSLVIFTNEIIKAEWLRHLDDAAHQVKQLNIDAKKYKDQLLAIGSYLGQNKDEIDELIKCVDETTARKIAKHEQHIERVKKFIDERTEIIAVDDEHRVEASKMALSKQAPFCGDKSNSMADALILLSITDFLDLTKANHHPAVKYALQEDGVVESYFVTSNFNDFAALPDKHTIHPDLAPILARSGTVYYPTLGLLVNKLEKEFLTQDELRVIENADHSIYCSVCDGEYPSIQISKETKLFDPFKLDGSNNPDQLSIFEEIAPVYQDPFVDVQTAYCDNCGADFITCPNCGDMLHIKEDEKTSCTGCHYKFLLQVERDRKGAIHGHEFIIVRNYICEDCGDDCDDVDEQGVCETCAEYRRIAENQ